MFSTNVYCYKQFTHIIKMCELNNYPLRYKLEMYTTDNPSFKSYCTLRQQNFSLAIIQLHITTSCPIQFNTPYTIERKLVLINIVNIYSVVKLASDHLYCSKQPDSSADVLSKHNIILLI